MDAIRAYLPEAVLVLCVVLVLALTGFFVTRWRYSPADWGSRFKNNLAGFVYWFLTRYHRLQCETIKLPDRGGAIVVANHVSGLDPLIMIACSPRPLRFLIAREQYDWLGLTWLFRMAGCIPVERDKRPEIALREAIRAINSGEVIALFPHGKIHLDSDPPIKIKGGATKLSELTGCEIFPLRIDGVRARGHVFPAILIRGRVRVTMFPAMLCHPDSMYANLHQLKDYLENRK